MSTVLLLVLPSWGADVDPFRPSGSLSTGQGTLQGESPFLLGEGISAGLFASFAQDLALRERGDQVEPLVRSALPAEIYVGWTIADRARLEVFAPVYAHVDAPLSEYSGAAFGDVRLQANVALWTGDAVGLSLVPRIELPTGTPDAFTKRGFSAGLTAALGGEAGPFGWVGNTGLSVSEASEFEGIGTGSAVELLGGGWWRTSPGFRLGLEAETQLGLVGREDGSNVLATGHVYGQTTLPSGLGLTVGAGTGLIAGVGAPGYRLFAALTYGTTVADRDGDGIVDPEDDCPDDPEDFDRFEDLDGCPDPDNDNDTIVDIRDDCPDDPEDFDDFEDADGCPDPDNDQDTVVDVEDACPLVPGTVALRGCPDADGDGVGDADDRCPETPGPAELEGCPDRDGDKVPDFRDACPDDPIDAEDDPATSDGCPKLAFVVGEQIKIGERVLFKTGSSAIDAQSYALLDAVAGLLERHTELRRVEVAGHTDNVGTEAYNDGLSDRRAGSVLTYLNNKGIARNRLVAKGYGETEPITTNRTPAGRQTNRRVEFNILEREPIKAVPVPRKPTPKAAPEPAPTAPKPAPTAPKPAPTAPKLAPTAPKPAPTAPKPATEPTPAAPKPAPAPEPAFDPEPTDLQNPWDRPDAPAPEPDIDVQESDLENPWGTTSPPEPSPAPATKAAPGGSAAPDPTMDPSGKPGRLTIILRQSESAEVYLDNERLPKDAPFERLPVIAGPHKLWVSDPDEGLDFETTLLIQNEKEQILVLPPGGVEAPSSLTDEPRPIVEDKPQPVEDLKPQPEPKRKGRRSKKR